MSDYIHLFETQAAHDAVYNGSGYQEPWTALVTATDTVKYNKSEYEKLLSTPLTFEIQSSGTIIFQHNSSSKTIEYKKNNGEWIQITSKVSYMTPPSISVDTGDIIQFRGNNQQYRESYFNQSTATFKAKGNIMSLINSTEFSTLTTLPSTNTFYTFFESCTSLTDVSKLILPALTMTNYCYASMFKNCTNITIAPKLPATTVANYCYAYMFQDCTNLVTIPTILPADTLAEYCYYYMFKGCSSLASAPELPATTLATWCYANMFESCTSLVTAPELPVTTLTSTYCYFCMFKNCTSLTTAPELPATTLTMACYQSMFENCSSLVSAPDLLATTLSERSYNSMFSGCTNLSSIKCLATNISASYCVNNWLYNVSSTGTFTKAASMTSWPSGASGIPENWTVVNAS